MKVSNARPRGFTLIEILIVVVILGILAAIVIPQFSSASQEASISSVRSQLQTLRSQIELYRVQDPRGEYPAGGTISSNSDNNVPGGFQTLVDGGYLQRLPEVPAGWEITFTPPSVDENNDPTGPAAVKAKWVGTGDLPKDLTAADIGKW